MEGKVTKPNCDLAKKNKQIKKTDAQAKNRRGFQTPTTPGTVNKRKVKPKKI